MTPRPHVILLALILLASSSLLSCGGEITAVTLGEGKQASFERFRDEVQPVLQAPVSEGDRAAGVGFRDCTAAFCHGSVNGVGGTPPLRIIADPDDAGLIENFRQVTSRLDNNDPEGSIFLTDPLTITPHGGQKNFRDEQDCCYLIVLNWMKDEPAPECTCPPE